MPNVTSHLRFFPAPWAKLYVYKRTYVMIYLPTSWFYDHVCFLDSSPPSPTYMRQWTVSALVQVMACRLIGAKPLPEQVLTYYQLDTQKQN